MNILSLFVRHGTEKYPHAHEELLGYYAERLSSARIDCVIIDNALPEGTRDRQADGTWLLSGSNACWEFSAWERALETFRPDLTRYDFVHFVTSAYRQLYTAYIERIDMTLLANLLGRDVMLGHIDSYGDPVDFLGCKSQAWLRSCFLFGSPATLRRLGSIVSLRDPGVWFSGNAAAPFRDDAPLSREMQAHIVGWLTGRETTWHSRFDLTPQTLPFFEAKAFAILNEHALTQRLIGQGTSVVDATWLSALLGGASGAQASSLIDWRSQLRERAPYL
ncbi:hypothetical protein [Ancylobacter sp.]|uniref:hypothetical protein n=1 Tax=Ancylobacter sp. TaxID=1872567 RepID=UPI003BAD6AAE